MKQKTNLIMALSSLLAMILGCSGIGKSPEWQKAQMLADKVDHPQAVITDEKFIYYVTGGTIASLNEGTSGVWKMPLAGGQPIQLFKGFQKNERSVVLPDTFVLAMDEKYVYWTSGIIWRTPKDGGESQEITAGMPTEMLVDDTKIYWHNFAGEGMRATPIYSADKNGGEAKAITDAANISAIALDKEFLYWSQPDGIYKMPKAGGEKSKVYSPPEKHQITDMLADNDNFFIMQGDGKMSLFKVPKKGGEAVKLASEINNAYHFYLDETHVYFVRNESYFETSISKVSKSGGEVTKIDSGYIASYTVGKDKIYVTDIAKIYALGK